MNKKCPSDCKTGQPCKGCHSSGLCCSIPCQGNLCCPENAILTLLRGETKTTTKQCMQITALKKGAKQIYYDTPNLNKYDTLENSINRLIKTGPTMNNKI